MVDYVKAKYEYEYKSSDGEPRKMQPGDQFVLIKKSNDDWWFVQQKGDTSGVYLPATYLEEVANSNGDKIAKRISSFGNQVPMHARNHGNSLNHTRFNQGSFNHRSNYNQGNNYDHDDNVIPVFDNLKVENEPQYMNFKRSTSVGDESSHTDRSPHSPHSPVNGNKTRFAPKFPADSLNTNSLSTFHPGPARSPDEHSVPPVSNTLLNDKLLPLGWQKVKDDLGVWYYTHENTTERWRMSKDDTGKAYFYSENRDTSQWELPDLSNLSSRRLSENLDDFGQRRSRKRSERVAKTQSVYVERNSRRSRTLPSGIPENDFANISTPYAVKLPQSVSAYNIDRRVEEDSPPTLVEKSGYMFCLRMKDFNRKSKNKVSKVYVVLTHSSIVIYKDQQMYEGKSGSLGRPESSIALVEATLKPVDKDFKPKGKNAFYLTSNTGSEVILYSEKSQETDGWHETIKRKISKLSPPGHTIFDEEPSEDQPHILNRRESRKTTDKKKIKNRLYFSILRRPTKTELEKKGILKEENVFGKRLDKLCEKEGTTIPKFVEACISTIDRKGLNVVGIYRLSANLSLVQKLRCEIDYEHEVNMDNPPFDDIHVISGALKLFFRELPDPLIPCQMYNSFITALKAPDRKSRIRNIRELVRRLPPCNYATMKLFFEHLVRVAAKAEVNNMTVHNLATVLGPTLMWPQEDAIGNVAANLMYQNQVIEILLNEMKNVF
ncbi:rho GTPase-activating protein 15-like [Antedon mediterranea]|uniref:rho GTPase-activating protein 15-like n=1 Tax=Antedon mediterranea TaxID=105859 RepID=UPI003AF992D2